jgi:hypothetical protein
MKRRSQSQKDMPRAQGITLGRDRFAKISAVEGIVVSPAGKQRAEEADRLGLSGKERRLRIERAYRKN